MRIALLTSTLEGGGAARVLTNMANHWTRAGHEVAMFTFEDGSRVPFYPLAPRAQLVHLDLARISRNMFASIGNNIRRIATIRRGVLALRPDVLISFIDTANVRALVSLAGSGVPVIVSERIHPAHEDIGPLWSALRLLTYPLARRVVVQTERAKGYFPTFLARKLVVIPNPVLPPPAGEGAPALPPRAVLAVGRLAPQKGYDILLEAFARIAPGNPQWTLHIAGGGGSPEPVLALAERLGIGSRVVLHGPVRDVGGLLRQAEIYVMSSRYEGFPNALCEAMAAGLPCVSTDCPSGPAEIIEHGVNGLLAPNADPGALAAQLERMMRDPQLRGRLGRNATALVETYSEERIMARWEALFTSNAGDR
jgi:glycosyltransferase involved in cell wall biosynthesis